MKRPVTVATAALALAGVALSATVTAARAEDLPGPLVTSTQGIDLDSAPARAIASPDGRTAYIASGPLAGKAGELDWVDPSGPRVPFSPTIGAIPMGLAVSPDGRLIASSSAPDTFVRVFDAASGRLLKKVPVGGRPDGLTIGPKGQSLFASVSKRGYVAKVDLKRLTVTGRYPVKFRSDSCHGRGPASLAVSRDSATLFVSCPQGGLFLLTTKDGRALGVIDQADGGAPIPSADGTHVYWGGRTAVWGLDVPNYPRVFTKDLPVDSDGDIMDVVDRIASPVSLAMTPDGSRVYATMPDIGAVSRVAVGDITKATSRLSVGGSSTFGAQELALDATGRRLYVRTADGRLITFDTSSDTAIGVDTLDFVAAGPKAVTRVIGPLPLSGSRVAFGWTRYDGPAGKVVGSGVSILTLK